MSIETYYVKKERKKTQKTPCLLFIWTSDLIGRILHFYLLNLGSLSQMSLRLSEVRPMVGEGGEEVTMAASLLGQSWPRSGVGGSCTSGEIRYWVWKRQVGASRRCQVRFLREVDRQVYWTVVVFSIMCRKEAFWSKPRFKKQKWNQYLWPQAP